MNPLFDEPQENVTLHCVCPKCGSEREKILTVPHSFAEFIRDITKVFCDSCGDALKAAEEQEQIERAKNEQMDIANIPTEFRKWNKEKGNIEAAGWVDCNRGSNLLLIGEVDTGKTRSMAKVLVEECNRGKRVLFLDFCEFAEDYAGAMQESVSGATRLLHSYIVNGGYDIILFDDIDKRRINETAGNLLYKMFNKLYSGETKAACWFTMNHDGKEFLRQFENKDYGAAVISRIDRMMKDGRFVVKNLNKQKGQNK